MVAGGIPALAGTPSERLQALLKFYDGQNMYPAQSPELADSNGGSFNWVKCLPANGERTIVKFIDGKIDENCMPDTLYTWQTFDRINEFTKKFSGAKWPDSFAGYSLFTHFNPVATFGYGQGSLRIKLKPGTRFKRVTDNEVKGDICKALSKAELSTTVLVRVTSAFTDFILCSPGPIQSWSTGTHRHYDEIVSSALWYFNESQKRNWFSYLHYPPSTDSSTVAVEPLFISEDRGGNKFDGHYFDEDTLVRNLGNFQYSINKKLSEIHFSPGSPSDEGLHFSTARPFSWNGLTAKACGPGLKSGTATTSP